MTRKKNPLTRYTQAKAAADRARKAADKAHELAEKAQKAADNAKLLAGLKEDAEAEEQAALEALKSSLDALEAF